MLAPISSTPAPFLVSSLLLISSSWVLAQGPPVHEPVEVVAEHAQQVLKQQDAGPCDLACASIAESLPSKVHYLNLDKSFQLWDAKQDELQPKCRVEPSNAEDVSLILKTLIREQCPFAVKSGGVARVAGTSNVDGGVAIDLNKNMKEVTLAADKKTVDLGAGATWGDVYSKLQDEEITVIGGRVSIVGVGGLLLGGGISFFTERHGWGCDNVVEYEVVLPDGAIANVTHASHPDLYWALRGGGNNFGIVTRFTVNAFPQGELFGGSTVHTQDKFQAVLKAYHTTVSEKLQDDVDADTWISFGWIPSYNMFVSTVQMMHAKPEMNPAVFDELRSIEPISSTLRVNKLTNFTDEIALFTPPNMRNLYRAISFEANAELNEQILAIYLEEVEPLKNITGIVPAVILQPITLKSVQHMGNNGGNALGLLGADHDMTLMSIALSWVHASDDALMEHFSQAFFDRVTKLARKKGIIHRYVYHNYAHSDQDVYRGYGVRNLERLRKISEEVDPNGVFARGGLCDGPFKVHEKKIDEKTEERKRDEL